ncbi:osmoprotectant ABC transporter substrate-binding protein [Peptoniphilus stercorisuis]|uniref:Osmoprotectant transport system substrate-binding protein n=1 Tax=Peptoniphilus stercorisuis TaxID=1436965 RepID=A0ABS4KDE2_9FIRM|nr:osmoprotectant transport system substrate-binding protein [Peptoniphilus stercorisuis]
MKLKKIFSIFLCALILTSCSLPGLGENAKKDIVIASGNNTEKQVLAEILKQMIEHYSDDLKVDIINNLGSTTLIHTTMLNGDVNISSGMYTGTSLTGELAMDPITDPELAMDTVQKGYKERFNRVWFPSYGFANTYAFMVREDYAKEHNLEKISDLVDLKDDMKVGVDTAWMDRKGDGYEDFKKKYSFEFKNIYPMELGLLYSAVKNEEMDAVLGYSTDGRINSYKLILLEDDLQLFPAYDCSPVASQEVLDEHPELENIIMKLIGKIDTVTMQSMNKKGAEDQIEPKYVAKEFLEENNYFENEVTK